jgi:hypothetical protein
MKGHGSKFGRKKEEAVAALLTHKSVEDAARSVGLNPNTLLKWLQVPEFRALYLKARREAASQAIARIQQGMGAAAITMLKLMTDPNVPAAVRLRAAEAVVGFGLKGIEVEDIEVRLAELEAAAAEDKNGKRR